MGTNMEQRVALVTGASRGIGRAIAQRLAEDGHYVVGTATTDSGAESITEYLGDKGVGIRLNVTSDEDLSALVNWFNTTVGRLPDILVNNAGITRDNLMMRMKEDEWQAVIDTNLTAIFKLTQRVLKGMVKKRWGRIVSVGSVVGSMGNAGQTNYAAAKAGVIGFSKSLAREVGQRGITVNVVAPGFIDTDMTRALSDEQREKLFAQIPAGRLGQPEEIAHAVSFLVSEQAGYITGTVLHVNGGMLMD
ncbi:MAG: 3-oxoacyl-ACP reductase FabG [Gammaproteobacteria bacterium]|nr:MAG: 3-oxoacyl-ACP reductase FabG [Gammaproteobacteria bacterium]